MEKYRYGDGCGFDYHSEEYTKQIAHSYMLYLLYHNALLVIMS